MSNHKLAITSIQRNRAPWLAEWVAFHHLVGFTHFYLYLHQCSDESEQVVRDLSKKFDITVIVVDPQLENPQLKCYHEAYEHFGQEVDWMAFIDGDEFLFPTVEKTIDKPLSEYANKDLSALGVYWACFGSSNQVKEPDGLILANYRYRADDTYANNRHIKSIVKGHQGSSVSPTSPHFFHTNRGTFDENMRPITKGWTDYDPTYHKFRINHYVTQSRSHFENFKSKIPHPDGAPARDEEFWAEHNKNEIFDHSIDRFVSPLKNLLSNV